MSNYALPILKSSPPVNCNACCACCMHMGSPPLEVFYRGPKDHYEDVWGPWEEQYSDDHRRFMALTPAERRAVYDDKFRDGPDEDRPCIWLDLVNMQCGKYDARPDICREFEVGGEGCMTHRRNAGIRSV